jgi:hypothetical protein
VNEVAEHVHVAMANVNEVVEPVHVSMANVNEVGEFVQEPMANVNEVGEFIQEPMANVTCLSSRLRAFARSMSREAAKTRSRNGGWFRFRSGYSPNG